MSFGPLEYLRHIRDEAAFLAERAAVVSKEEFLKDDLLRRGFGSRRRTKTVIVACGSCG
jgi:hypothetical protein